MACFQAVGTSCLTKVTDNHTSQLVTLFTSVKLFWQSSKQNAKSTGYLRLNKLCVQKVLSFPFACFCFLFIDFYERFNFLSLILRDTVCFSRFPRKFFARFWRKAGQNCFRCACLMFNRCFLGVTTS